MCHSHWSPPHKKHECRCQIALQSHNFGMCSSAALFSQVIKVLTIVSLSIWSIAPTSQSLQFALFTCGDTYMGPTSACEMQLTSNRLSHQCGWCGDFDGKAGVGPAGNLEYWSLWTCAGLAITVCEVDRAVEGWDEGLHVSDRDWVTLAAGVPRAAVACTALPSSPNAASCFLHSFSAWFSG